MNGFSKWVAQLPGALRMALIAGAGAFATWVTDEWLPGSGLTGWQLEAAYAVWSYVIAYLTPLFQGAGFGRVPSHLVNGIKR